MAKWEVLLDGRVAVVSQRPNVSTLRSLVPGKVVRVHELHPMCKIMHPPKAQSLKRKK